MKSVVVMTYYQLMHSIALALTFDEKPNLFFSMSYINADDAFIERIKGSGVFNDVVAITRRQDLREFLRAMRKTIGADARKIDKIRESLFEEYLEPHYKELFKDADFNDDIYVYNDFQWHYYYISKHFKSIIGVEDGYASLLQQLSIHRFRGKAELVIPFVERGYYPEPLYKHKNIKIIISSKDFGDALDDYYRRKIKVWDFKDIVALNEDRFKEAITTIFEMDRIVVADKSSLYLGQPLDRAKYCTYLENYLLTKKIIKKELERGNRVYLKPHPAERNDVRIFQEDGAEILPKDFPAEILNYQDKKFSRLVTFSSTGSSLINCAKEEARIYDKIDTTPKDVSQFIEEQISGEQLVVDLFLIIKKMTPEMFVYVYSSTFRHKSVHTNIHLLTNSNNCNDYLEYFDRNNVSERIKEYKSKRKKKKEQDLWYSELESLPGWIEEYRPSLFIHQVTSLDERDIFEEEITKLHNYDYVMLMEPKKTNFWLTERIIESFDSLMFSAIFFENYTYVKSKKNNKKKISLKPGYVGNSFGGGLFNILFHKTIIDCIKKCGFSYSQVAEVVNDYSDTICRKQGEILYTSPKKYLSIQNVP